MIVEYAAYLSKARHQLPLQCPQFQADILKRISAIADNQAIVDSAP